MKKWWNIWGKYAKSEDGYSVIIFCSTILGIFAIGLFVGEHDRLTGIVLALLSIIISTISYFKRHWK